MSEKEIEVGDSTTDAETRPRRGVRRVSASIFLSSLTIIVDERHGDCEKFVSSKNAEGRDAWRRKAMKARNELPSRPKKGS
ncbi:hypothetical protein KM043_003934 [Ampulex compressa]|nr:hypothetical protein KM043_003934 [Ampulex compressa]